ncbi:hypothetical protein B0A50_06341 [Salinomyces thailandicus]|uniref:AB hydrolase-1 domain-containing protein n=1 Tax=Salinomyces thailandicus TaxID=706561 RepID=A0A4U0TR10_9PEZI|nr:hypothetical protein B0A50_06341 [Salinomyces thailandica]
MAHLDVPGASLYYETLGSGPLLLCISGANGSCEIWKPLAIQLRKHFTVVSYDRRGYSRSTLSGAQDYDQRLQTDADDAAHLIHHISPDEPATVLGNSSGAIVALELLTRHPDCIRNLLPHEPPAATLLEDLEDIKQEHQAVYQLYRKAGVAPAAERFAESIKAGPETAGLLRSMDPKAGPYNFANSIYWFERELGHYAAGTEFDLHKLQAQSSKLLLLNGRDSHADAMQYRPNVKLAEMFGLELHIVPGGHMGFVLKAPQFAKEVYEILKDKDSSY